MRFCQCWLYHIQNTKRSYEFRRDTSNNKIAPHNLTADAHISKRLFEQCWWLVNTHQELSTGPVLRQTSFHRRGGLFVVLL
jgi:hypothetical protein